MKQLYHRGRATVELPYLLSCALYLLDRRYWIVGVRYPWYGVRFDLVVRDPSAGATALVETKYRTDGRPIRPYEIENFRRELTRATHAGTSYYGRGIFMTNTRFSDGAKELATEYGILTYSHVPLLFRLFDAPKKTESQGLQERTGNEGKHQP